MTILTSEPNAAGVRWDLSPLAADADAARTEVAALVERCRDFASRYRGQVATIDAVALAAMLAELADLHREISRVGSYGHLREAVDITDTETRDLAALMDRTFVEVGNALRFVDLEWIALDDATAGALAAAPEVARDRHHLESLRRFAPHTLSEPEERMLAERSPAATSAWHMLFGQITSTLETDFDAGEGPEPHGIDRLLSYMREPDRDLRHRALAALYDMLRPHTSTLAHCYDTLVADRLAMDRLRSYAGPMDSAHLKNELGGEVVDGMMDAVDRNYGLAQTWFVAKADLLGLDRLTIADQYAPIGAGRDVRFDEAMALVVSAFSSFSPRVGEVATSFIDERRVDAEPRNGKRGGAFCSPISDRVRPFVLLNHTDRMNDVLTIAHEFGHGMHFQFSFKRQTPLSASPGIAMCEIPSTFAEQITYEHLLAQETDPATRRALACERVEGAFATIFRQVVLARYEQACYAQRANGVSLTPDRLGANWHAANLAYYGDALDMPDDYRMGWSYIPHFIHTRFYTYSYAFALLVSLVLVGRYRRDGDAFVEPYLRFLESGDSAAPAALLAELGLDLSDPGVWDEGFAELARMIEEARAE